MGHLSDDAQRALRAEYFADAATRTYMIIDGAAAPALTDHLYDEATDFGCLLSGDLTPDLAEVAPYLLELIDGSPFADWVIGGGFGGHWGIVLRSSLDQAQLLRRFRQTLFVRDEQGELLYFRFYDPRVLRVFLPTCLGHELWPWFDNIEYYLVEGEEPGTLMRFSAPREQLEITEIRLGAHRTDTAHQPPGADP